MVGTLEDQYRWSGSGGVSVYSPTRRVRTPAVRGPAGGQAPLQIHQPAGWGGGQAPIGGMDLGRRIDLGSPQAMQTQEPEQEGGWRGLLGSIVNNPIGRVALMPLNLLDTPRRIVVSTAKEIGDVFAGGASMSDWWDQVKDVNFGVGSFLHIDGPNNLFNRWANRLIGLGGDILLDPMTYLGGSSLVSGASRRMRLTMGAVATGIEGISPEVARTLARRGVGTIDDATRAILRQGGVAVKDASYYFKLPFVMGEHARIPGTAGLDRLMSRTTGRILPAVSNATIGNMLGHWAADESLQGAARRMLTNSGTQSFQTAATTYLYAQTHKLSLRSAERVGAADAAALLQRHGEEALNAAVHESETLGTGPVAEFFKRARVRNDQNGVRHGVITSQVNGQQTVTYVPHYRTPEFNALLNSGEPMSAALRKALGSGATFDDISQSAQRRMLVPRAEPYDILGKQLQITTGTIDEFNEGIAKLFPDFKGKALYDDFRTIADRYVVGQSRDIAQMAGVRKLLDTGMLRKGADADPLVTEAINTALSTKANKTELTRLRSADRVAGKTVREVRTNLSAQYGQITGQLGTDLHKIVDELQTLPPELQDRIRKNIVVGQSAAGAAKSTTNEAVREAAPSAGGVATKVDEVPPELMTAIDESITHVEADIAKRKVKIDKLAPRAAEEIDKMNVAMASGDPEKVLAAAAVGVPIKQEWDALVNDQMGATLDRQALVEMEHRLGEHKANVARLRAAREDNALMDLFESHLGAEANTVTIGSTRVPVMRLTPAEPGEVRWHVPAHTNAEGVRVPARNLRARIEGDATLGQPGHYSWEVRQKHLTEGSPPQPGKARTRGLPEILADLPEESEVKRWGNVVLAKAQKLSREEKALYDAATSQAAAIDRAKGQLTRVRREERSLQNKIDTFAGRPSKQMDLQYATEELRLLREGSLAEATNNYTSAQAVVSEAEARYKTALVDYNQSVQHLTDAATSEDRRLAERRLIDAISSPEVRRSAAAEAVALVERAEARYGPKITKARAEVDRLDGEVDRAVANTARAEERLAAARKAQADFGLSPRERRRRRLAGEEVDTDAIARANFDVREKDDRLRRARQNAAADRELEARGALAAEEAQTRRAANTERLQRAEAELADAKARRDQLTGTATGANVWDQRVADAESKLVAARHAERKLKQARGAQHDIIADTRDKLTKAREAADQVHNPLARHGYTLDRAQRELADLKDQLDQANQRVTQARHGSIEMRNEAQSINEAFAEIEDTPRTWAARREGSRQRRQFEARAAQLEEEARLATIAHGQLAAQVEAAQTRIDYLSGALITRQQPVSGGIGDDITKLFTEEERYQKIAESPNKVKVHWEPVPEIPVRAGLDVEVDEATRKIIDEVVGQGGALAPDALRRIETSQFPERQRNALESSPFGKGGQQNLATRAKDAVANSEQLLTDHAARLVEPGPNGLAAASLSFVDGHRAKTSELAAALKAYGENATTGNLTRLEQLSSDVTLANAYLAVYKEALATGVEPSPEVGALILEQVVLRDYASKQTQRANLAKELSPEGYAKSVEKLTARAEKAFNSFMDAYTRQQEMLTWRDIGDPRFSEEELRRIGQQVSDRAKIRGKYYDAEGNLKLPAADPVLDSPDLDYLTDVVHQHMADVDEAEGLVSAARTSPMAVTAMERQIYLEASIDTDMRYAASASDDLNNLADAIKLAEELGMDTVELPPAKVKETFELTIAEAEQMLRENDNLSPSLRREISKNLGKARETLAKQNATDNRWLRDELGREARASFSGSQAEAALERGEVAEASFRLRESERYGENIQLNEQIAAERRAVQEMRETRVYSMTDEGERGELLRVINPEEGRETYKEVVDKTKVRYSVWEPGVEITEVPIDVAREMHDSAVRGLRKKTSELTHSMLEHDVLSGEAAHQLNYIRQIMKDNRVLADPAIIEAEANQILEAARATGRDLTQTETEQVALLQARAAVRRQNLEGMPAHVRVELLERGDAIRKMQREIFNEYDIRGSRMVLTADQMTNEVKRILDKEGDLTLEELDTLAAMVPHSPEQARAVDALRKALTAIREQRTRVGREGGMRGKTIGEQLLSDEEMMTFRNQFAAFYGDNGAQLYLKDIQDEVDKNLLTPMGVSEEGEQFGDMGVTAARGRMRENFLARARLSRNQAIEDLKNTLQVAGLQVRGNKTVAFYRNEREAIRRQLEARGVKTTYLTSERLAELDARLSTLEVILRSLGRPVAEGQPVDYVDTLARAARMEPGSTIGAMLADVRDQLGANRFPDSEMEVASKAFRRDLRSQITAARAAGDTERATHLGKLLTELDQRPRIYDRNAPIEEFVPPPIDSPTTQQLNPPDINALTSEADAATQRRTRIEEQLATARGAQETAAQTAGATTDDPAQVLTEQLATVEARLEAARQWHASEPPLPEHEISPSERVVAGLEMERWALKGRLAPLTAEEQAASDKIINDLMQNPLGMRQRVRPKKNQRFEMDRINSIVPPNGRSLDGDPGTMVASGAPAAMDDTVRDLERKLEAAQRSERHAQTELANAKAQVDGSANPSMVDNEAAAMSAEGTPAPSVDQIGPAAAAPSPDAAVPPPTAARPELEPITDPDLQAVQQEYDIAVSNYQEAVGKYGSYEAADETGQEIIGRASERVRRLDAMRQSMKRDAEIEIMRGDTALAWQLDQEARAAQRAALEARNITSDPEYILLHGTPSQKVMSEHARNFVPPRKMYGFELAQTGQLGPNAPVRSRALDIGVQGRFEDAGRTRALPTGATTRKLVPSRLTYYDEARRRLDNLIDREASQIDEIEQQLDAVGVVRNTVGDTPELQAREAELLAQHRQLNEQAGRSGDPGHEAKLERRRAEEADYTQQLRDVGATPLVHARELLSELHTVEGRSALTADLAQAIIDTRQAATEAERQALSTSDELSRLLAGRTEPATPLALSPASVVAEAGPATNPVAPLPAPDPNSPIRYSDEDLAAAQAPVGPPMEAKPFFVEEIPPAAAVPPATAAPTAVPPAAAGPPPAVPPVGGGPTPPAAGGPPKPPQLPKHPNKKTGTAADWQAVLNDLNDINEARRVLGVSNADVNQTAALLVAAAASARDLAKAEVDYALIHKRLMDFKQGSEKVANVMKDVAVDGWRMLTWPTLPENERYVIAEELGHSLDNFHKAISLPDTWNLLDHYTRFFKTYATGRPGFHVRNTMSSMFMNLVAGVRLSAMWDASSLWRQFEKDPYEFLSGLNPDSLEYKAFSAVFGSGAAGTFEEVGRQVGETIPGRTWRKVIDNRYTRWNKRMGARVEGSVRLGMAIDSMRRGQDPISAMNRIAKYHFDYTEMSRLDRQARRLIPFWTFLSRNLPLQIEQMWARPRTYLQYKSLVRNFGEAADPLTPQYWLDSGAFTMDENAGTDTQNSPSSWMAQLDLPFETAGETINAALAGNFGKAILSDINPSILAPLEAFGFNRKMFTGAPLEEGSFHQMNPAQTWMLPLFKLLGATDVNAQGETLIDDRYAHVARTINPIQDLAERITDTTGTRAGRQDETLMRYLGIPVREVTPEIRANTRTTAYYDARDEARQRGRIARAGTRD